MNPVRDARPRFRRSLARQLAIARSRTAPLSTRPQRGGWIDVLTAERVGHKQAELVLKGQHQHLQVTVLPGRNFGSADTPRLMLRVFRPVEEWPFVRQQM